MSELPQRPRRDLLKLALTAATVVGVPRLAAGSAHTPGTMRAYQVGEYDNGYQLSIIERQVPVPGPGQVLMKVHATGINARDLSLLKGLRMYGTEDRNVVPLDDNAGEVLETGPGVKDFQPGDRVVCTHFPLWVDGPWDDEAMSTTDFGVNTDGFLAESAVVPAQGLVKIPASIAYTDAATYPNAGLTAWNGVVVDGRVRPGETVLTLGSGGVSVFAMQWAKLKGARVIITSSSDDKLERLKELGADETVNYRSHPEWHEKVREKTGGRGVDLVINTVGMSELERCLKSCASNGRVMHIGANPVARGEAAREPREPVAIERFPRGFIMKGLTVKGVIVGSRQMLQDLVAASAEHNIRPVVDKVFDFEDALEAVNYFESGRKIGKVVIRVA